jgi:hypothetical protein
MNITHWGYDEKTRVSLDFMFAFLPIFMFFVGAFEHPPCWLVGNSYVNIRKKSLLAL